MKGKIILIFLIFSITHIGCKTQENSQILSDEKIVISTCPVFIYPLTSDKKIERIKHCGFIYPLLILNGIIRREEKQINYFRNQFDFSNIKKTKRISQKEAEKKGISNVPKDGVLFVTTKKGCCFVLSCE